MFKQEKTPILISLLLTIAMTAPTSMLAQQNDPMALATAQIVKARDYTTEYVAIAKDSFAKNPADLSQSRKLYAAAYSDYDAWVAYMRTALEDGRTKNLGTDPDYKQKASDASSAAIAFTNFVDSKTESSKAVNVLLASLGALGLQLWNGVADRRQQQRCVASENFAEMTRWYPWEAISDDTLKNPPTSSPAPLSDLCKQSASPDKPSGKNAPADTSRPSTTKSLQSQSPQN